MEIGIGQSLMIIGAEAIRFCLYLWKLKLYKSTFTNTFDLAGILLGISCGYYGDVFGGKN